MADGERPEMYAEIYYLVSRRLGVVARAPVHMTAVWEAGGVSGAAWILWCLHVFSSCIRANGDAEYRKNLVYCVCVLGRQFSNKM